MLIRFPHSHLKTKCIDVENINRADMQVIVKELFWSLLHEGKERGVGISCPQIEREHRIFVLSKQQLPELDEEVFVNPRYMGVGSTEKILESCLSFPEGISVRVSRYPKIIASFITRKGKLLERTYEGLAAQAYQHEVDHLNGITLFDHANPKEKKYILKLVEQAHVRRRNA